MEKLNILNLPMFVLSTISSLLAHNDLLTFRVTCITFYDASVTKTTLRALKIRPRSLNKWFYKFTTKIFGGRFVKMSLLKIKSDQLKDVLSRLPNIEDLEINMQQLRCVQGACKNLKSLSLYDKDLNFFIKMDPTRYKSFFENTLGELPIKTLCIIGSAQTYYSVLVMEILKSARSIETFSLKSLQINHIEPKDAVMFKIIFLSCNHIKHWVFNNTAISAKKGLFLPETILSYKCIHSDLLLLDKRHTRLEKLVVNGISPRVIKIWKQNDFVNLKYLEFRNCFFYHGNLANCSKLKVLKLSKCHLPFTYLMNLSISVKHSLSVLHIESYKEFDNNKLIKVIESFTELRELTLTNVNEITPMFLYEVKHEKLKFIFLKNCYGFNKKNSKIELDTMKNTFPFTVHIDTKV